jgi:hypothetical protein
LFFLTKDTFFNMPKCFKYWFGELDLNHPFDDDDGGSGMHEDEHATSYGHSVEEPGTAENRTTDATTENPQRGEAAATSVPDQPDHPDVTGPSVAHSKKKHKSHSNVQT